MERPVWNHNIHYHDVVLQSLPSPCRLALDVGCGNGPLTQQLGESCNRVIGIDVDQDAIAQARSCGRSLTNVTYVTGDVLTHPFEPASFDLIAVVAALHHMPLEAALKRFRDLLTPNGTLVVIGLYRAETASDVALAAAALLVSHVLRRWNTYVEVSAPIRKPKESLKEIKTAAASILPGSVLKRRLLFRYSLVWTKP